MSGAADDRGGVDNHGMQIPVSLTRHIAEKRCILFVGAGLSAAAGLPTWGRLLEQVIEELESSGATDAPDLRTLWQARKYLEVADHCADARGTQLRNVLTSTVRGATEPVPEVHKVLRDLPFAGIVTTNYDKLLERAYWGTDRIPKVHTHASKDAFGTLLFDRAFFILKAHGEIDEPDTIVLSTATYRELIHANPAFNAVMSAILLNFSILFVGYSLNDPDFRLLMERQISDFKGSSPARYALLDGLGTVEAQILQRNVGIQVINYPKGDHGQVLTFFQELRESVRKEEAKRAPVDALPAAAVAEAAVAEAAVAPPVAKRERAMRSSTRPKKAAATVVQATLQLRLTGTELAATYTSDGSALSSSTAVPDWTPLANLIGIGVDASHGAHAVRSIANAGLELRKCLSAEVLDAIGQLGPAGRLELELDEALRTVPWEWLYTGGQPLCLATPLFRRAASNQTGMPHAPRVLVIGDPHENLPGAMAEADDVAQLSANMTFLRGKTATFSRLVDFLEAGRFHVVHFAGHAWTENGEGRLYLADKTSISARELRSFVSRNAPAVMFLNSHYTAFLPFGVAGKEGGQAATTPALATNVFGFADMAASAGVGAFIGCFGSPMDDSARDLGVLFHRALGEGASATEALWRARVEVAQARPQDPTPLYYTGSGVGSLRGEVRHS